MTTTLPKTAIEIRTPRVPKFVLEALARADALRDSARLKTIFHFVWLQGADSDPERFQCVGVVGDGENGVYEMVPVGSAA